MSNKPSNTRGGTSHFPRSPFRSYLPATFASDWRRQNEEEVRLESLEFPSNPRFSMCVDSIKGLTNKPGENSCFMNSPVQILWHLDSFRKNFRLMTAHACKGDSCVFCSLKYVYTNYQFSDQPVLSSQMLRESLAETFHEQQKFQIGSMDDASECYETILDCLHYHVVPNNNNNSKNNNTKCNAPHCLTHRKMSLEISEETLCSCGGKSKRMIYDQIVYYVSTEALVNLLHHKDEFNKLTFAQYLKRAREQGDQRPCLNPSCKRQASKVQTLCNSPDVVTIGFVWDSEYADISHIHTLIRSIALEIRPCDLFHDTEGKYSEPYNLVGLLCYYAKHYCVFLFHPKQKIWLLYDDDRVTMLDERWESAIEQCYRGRLQPLLLLYSNTIDSIPIDMSTAPNTTVLVSSNEKWPIIEEELPSSESLGSFRRHPSYVKAVFRNLSDQNAKHKISEYLSQYDQTVKLSYESRTPHPQKQKLVRFRKEVESLSLEGEVEIFYLEGSQDQDDRVVSVPQTDLTCYSEHGIRKLKSSFDQEARVETSSQTSRINSFAEKTKEFLRLSSIKERDMYDDGDYDEPYINSQLVKKVLQKTVPKLHSLSNVYQITKDIFPRNFTDKLVTPVSQGPLITKLTFERPQTVNSNSKEKPRNSYRTNNNSDKSNLNARDYAVRNDADSQTNSSNSSDSCLSYNLATFEIESRTPKNVKPSAISTIDQYSSLPRNRQGIGGKQDGVFIRESSF